MGILTVTNTADNGYGTPAVEGSLRAAIEAAKPGDTIRFDGSLTKETITLKRRLEIDKNITIDAQNASDLTLNGKDSGIIIQVNGDNRNVTLRNLKLTDASHDYNGAAIRVMGAKATIKVEDSEFYDNTAGYGAAIWAKEGANVTVVNSKFDGNKSTADNDSAAGAISVFNNSELTVKGSEFTNNEGISGGAIGTVFTELTIEDSTFRNNKSVKWGGAVHNDGASVPNQERYYKGNLPRDTEGGKTIIRNSSFVDNTSQGFGGAVSIWGYDQDYVTIEGSEFLNNKVTKNKSGQAKGGAIRVSGKLVTLQDNTIANNTSADEGGGLWYQGESPVEIDNTNFKGNKATDQGGAIYSHQWGGPGTDITNSKFEKNQAREGGAIYKNKPKSLDIDNTSFVGNSPDDFAGNTKNINVGDSSPTPQSPAEAPTETPVASQVQDSDGSDSGTSPDSQQNGNGSELNQTEQSTNNSIVRYEVEDLELNNYEVEVVNNSGASGGKHISLKNASETTGKVTGIFDGQSGMYEVEVGYYDENDGVSSATVTVADKSTSFQFDRNLPSNYAALKAKTSRVTHQLVELQSGDSFEIIGTANDGEFARFDYIEFTQIDPILGDSQDNQLVGTDGDDQIFAGAGNDTLTGGKGNDTLIGVEPGVSIADEQDILQGGDGADTFVLGDENQVYYNDGDSTQPGLSGYAVIEDFNPNQNDVIQLHGQASDYTLGATTVGIPNSIGIFLQEAGENELIAVVNNTQNLDLQSSAFNYV
ncbi:MAG: hypothetical protein QNJ51_03465 [Calothrix sp. MO_167.B12]|nr:hypothetical protein [Calothrix sp. MO_167.B12]